MHLSFFVRVIVARLLFQSSEAFFDSSDAGFSIGFLLLLKGYDFRFCVGYEALITEFFHYVHEETFLVAEVCFEFGNLFLYIDKVAEGDSVLGCAYDEGSTSFCFGLYVKNFAEVAELSEQFL